MFEFHNNRIYSSALIKSVSTLIKSTFTHTVMYNKSNLAPSQCHAYHPKKRKYSLDCAYGYTLIIMAYCFIPIFHITCFEVGQEGKYITNLILKDFKETK